MTNVVLALPPEKIKLVIETYAHAKVARNGAGIQFAAKLPDTSITVYKSGKVMFQGSGASREAKKFGDPVAKKKPVVKGDILPENLAALSVLGSDETGTGDYFGPITVAAVYVPANKIQLIQTLGAKDSKQMNDEIIRRIAKDIMASCPYSLLILRNEKYNELQAKGYSQGKMKALLHNQALQNVLQKISPEEPDYILIDQFAERGVYYNYLKHSKEIVSKRVLLATKAESLHISVAAASIIARYAFLVEMDKLSKTLGMNLQKGASSKVDEMAAKILKEQGEDTLRSISKWHFANTDKAKELYRKRYL